MHFHLKVAFLLVFAKQFGLPDLVGYNRLGNNVMFHRNSRNSIEKNWKESEDFLIRKIKKHIQDRSRKCCPTLKQAGRLRQNKRFMKNVLKLSD